MTDERGDTGLHHAALAGEKKACKALLRYCADINARNLKGEGPVDKAREGGHADLALYLREKGAEG